MAKRVTGAQIRPVETVEELRGQVQRELNRVIDALNDEVLRKDLNANHHRIRNLAPGAEFRDAVNVSQLQDQLVEQRTDLVNIFTNQISGIAGTIVFVDKTLSGAHTVVPPSTGVDSIIIFTFTQDGTGGHVVTWPAGFARQYHVGLDANLSSVLAFRVRSGPKYDLLWSGLLNRLNV